MSVLVELNKIADRSSAGYEQNWSAELDQYEEFGRTGASSTFV